MNKELLKKTIDKWGKGTQINKLQEKALELALVLNQRNCPTKDPHQMEEMLYDELADMKIMMAQAELIFDAGRIEDRVQYKLEKLQEDKIDKIIEEVVNQHPYKERGKRDSDSRYNEGWSDACDILGQKNKPALVLSDGEKVGFIKRLQDSIDFALDNEEDLNAASWNGQEGILISVNEAKLLLQYLYRG